MFAMRWWWLVLFVSVLVSAVVGDISRLCGAGSGPGADSLALRLTFDGGDAGDSAPAARACEGAGPGAELAASPTIVGAVSFSSGHEGVAATLDGGGEYIDTRVDISAALMPSLTLAAWIKFGELAPVAGDTER